MCWPFGGLVGLSPRARYRKLIAYKINSRACSFLCLLGVESLRSHISLGVRSPLDALPLLLADGLCCGHGASTLDTNTYYVLMMLVLGLQGCYNSKILLGSRAVVDGTLLFKGVALEPAFPVDSRHDAGSKAMKSFVFVDFTSSPSPQTRKLLTIVSNSTCCGTEKFEIASESESSE